MTLPDPWALTPVQPNGGHLVKRDDEFVVAGHRGGKARTCLALVQQAAERGTYVVTAGSRHSPQVAMVAAIARLLGVPCRVHVPTGPDTPELAQAAADGAQVFRHRPGHNSVIIARAAADAAVDGSVLVPFGMEHPLAVAYTAHQVANLPERGAAMAGGRLVVPVGSGMSLAGILTGLAANPTLWRAWPVLGVVVGAWPERRLARWAPLGWQQRVELRSSGVPYDHRAAGRGLGALPLDPVYEAKCLPHLRPGDVLWVVGRRAG